MGATEDAASRRPARPGGTRLRFETSSKAYDRVVAEPPDLLVSDRDRARVGEDLRTHYEAGRLTLDEFQGRLDELHGARTESQLESVLRQLPPARLPSVNPRDRRWRSLALQYAIVNVIAISIWLATGADGEFWPRWVLIVTLIMFMRRTFGHRHHRALPRPPRPPR
jgi:hypothetical protein